MLSPSPALSGEFEMRFDQIADIDEHGGGALLAIVLDGQIEIGDIPRVHRLADRGHRRLMRDLVAPDRLEADRLEHMDRIDDPCDRRLPVDRLENAARGGGRHHIIGDALDLHFRPGEAGVIPGDQQADAESHIAPRSELMRSPEIRKSTWRTRTPPSTVIARSPCDEAIQGPRAVAPGLLRCARNDGGVDAVIIGHRADPPTQNTPHPPTKVHNRHGKDSG